MRSQARSLGAERLFGDLDQNFLVLFEALFEREVRDETLAPPASVRWRGSFAGGWRVFSGVVFLRHVLG